MTWAFVLTHAGPLLQGFVKMDKFKNEYVLHLLKQCITKPFCFRIHYYLRVTVIIDCFKSFIEKPLSLFAKACMWSSYKNDNTAKCLITITPQGVFLLTEDFLLRKLLELMELFFAFQHLPKERIICLQLK